MNGFDARQFVASSLRKRGAACKVDMSQSGKVNIIATWRVTIWRILVMPLKVKTDKISQSISRIDNI